MAAVASRNKKADSRKPRGLDLRRGLIMASLTPIKPEPCPRIDIGADFSSLACLPINPFCKARAEAGRSAGCKRNARSTH